MGQCGSPCNLDHLGLIGLHVLQKGLHSLSCVNDGLREKGRATHGIKSGGASERRLRLTALIARLKSLKLHMHDTINECRSVHDNLKNPRF